MTFSFRVGLASALLAVVLTPSVGWGWGNDGHEIIAIIAASHLDANARAHVAAILGVDPNDPQQVATGMALAAIRPDTEFREEDRSTAPWHFIDLCLQDQMGDISQRCADNNCVTGKIDDYTKRLKDGDYDRWGAAGDLAYLIHFVGDVHQPLHTATNGDRGGNCLRVEGIWSKELHPTWDTALVEMLEEKLGAGRGASAVAAERLQQFYQTHPYPDGFRWHDGAADSLAWESTLVARSEVYARLKIPEEACHPEATSCSDEANGEVVVLSPDYLARETDVVGLQLHKAGMRLAALLNQIWPGKQPNMTGFSPSPGAQSNTRAMTGVSSSSSGPIVGNRRSMIYAWPGCRSYDSMAPHNRVVFPSREAAEAAGYRAARNCP
jgi:hypothetical protein